MPDRLSLAQANSPQPIVVVGSVAYDSIETPFDRGDRILGGSATFAGIAASYFTDVNLVGVVGHDFKTSDVERLRARGINLDGLQHDQSGPTFFWSGRYHDNFQSRDTLDIQLNVFEHFRPELPAHYASNPYALLGNIHPNLQKHVRETLAKPRFVVADTIDLWINIEKEALISLLPDIDMLVINDEEATALTDTSTIAEAGEALRRMGPPQVIVKSGAGGSDLFHAEGTKHIAAVSEVDLRDPTGAGDAYAGALLGYLAATDDTSFENIAEGMHYATALASLTIEAFSLDRVESAGVSEIDRRVASLR